MKKHVAKWGLLILTMAALEGCVAIPPLIQVQHKENNDEIKRRLDSIDQRLNRLEPEKATNK